MTGRADSVGPVTEPRVINLDSTPYTIEKHKHWVQDQWSGEMVEYEIDVKSYPLGDVLESGETVTLTWTETMGP